MALRWLVAAPERTSAWDVISWWEIRRPVYNLIMLPAGIAGVLFLILVWDLHPHVRPGDFSVLFVWVWIALGAVGANVCYTAGWLVTLALGAHRHKLHPRLWVAGTLFSCAVPFLPGAVHVLFWLFPEWAW